MDNFESRDLSRLASFLKQTDSLINYLVKNPHDFVLKKFVMDEEFWALVLGAWEDVRTNLREVQEKLQALSSNVWHELELYGLTGIQLKLKLEMFDRLLNDFKNTRAQRYLWRLLGMINSLLDSLASVFPPIEAVSEFKETLEQIIKMRERPGR